MSQDAGAVPAVPEAATAAEAIVDQVEADVDLALRRRVFARTRQRAAQMKADLERMVEDVVAAKDPVQAVAVYMQLEGSRAELAECFKAVNPAFAASAAGRAKVEEMVGRIVDGLIVRLGPALPADDPLPGPPPPGSDGGSPVLQSKSERRMLPTTAAQGGRRRASGSPSD